MDIAEVLEKHRAWLRSEPNGERANLRNADLTGTNLIGTNLTNADLRNANLTGTNLISTNLTNADLRNANLTNANLRNADLTNANLSQTKGLLNPDIFIAALERTTDGVICYKTFGANYASPEVWKQKPGAIIEEVVNYDRCLPCACGVNVSTLAWQGHNRNIWKCLVRWEWLAGVCVPYNTDGKFRVGKAQLLKKIN